jgi:hypothetical protein
VAALAQGIQGNAMDYILFPGPAESAFANGAKFAVHIRHVMLRSPELPSVGQLETMWDNFQESHTSIHARATAVIASDEE